MATPSHSIIVQRTSNLEQRRMFAYGARNHAEAAKQIAPQLTGFEIVAIVDMPPPSTPKPKIQWKSDGER